MKSKFISALALVAACMIAVCCADVNPGYTPTDPVKPTPTPPENPPTPPAPTHSDFYETNIYLRDNYIANYYYWNNEVASKNSKLDADAYPPTDYFYELLYSGDRWSWCISGPDYGQYSSLDGTWGVAWGQAEDYGIYVRYIYPGSPLEEFGVTRGAHLMSIAGTDIEVIATQEQVDAATEGLEESPQTFTFRLTDGRDTTFTTSWASSLEARSALGSKIFTEEDFEGLKEPVGYFHYLSFDDLHLSDIDTAMMKFRDAGINKLIIDLRYNGGGSSIATQRMMDYLVPEQYTGEVYASLEWNSILTNAFKNSVDESDYVRDSLDKFGKVSSSYSALAKVVDYDHGKYYQIVDDLIVKPLELDEVFLIIGPGSASASEKLVNELEPFLGEKEHTVGQQSHGKPNGMYVLLYPDDNASDAAYARGDYDEIDYIFLPICFYSINKNKVHIPDNGFIPDKAVTDDIMHDFGPQEANINACLNYIVNGTYPDQSTKANVSQVKGKKLNLPKLVDEDDPLHNNFTKVPDRRTTAAVKALFEEND